MKGEEKKKEEQFKERKTWKWDIDKGGKRTVQERENKTRNEKILIKEKEWKEKRERTVAKKGKLRNLDNMERKRRNS